MAPVFFGSLSIKDQGIDQEGALRLRYPSASGDTLMDEPQWIQSILGGAFFSGPSMVFVFGLFLVLGVLGAILAHAVKWLPTITAFMLLGIVFGPSGLDWIDSKMLYESKVLIDIALGLILYKLGCEVQLRHLLRSTSILRLSFWEWTLTFVAVFVSLLLFGQRPLVAGLVAAISVSSSPAVLVHMAEELEARGPVIYQAKALLTLNNVMAFFLFSLIMPFALNEEAFHWIDMLAIPLYRALGAVVVGTVVAYAMTQIDKYIDNQEAHFRFALIIGGIAMTLGLTDMLGVSSLFASLTLGIITRWLETQRQGLSSVNFGPSGDLFFIVLFVMAGANLHLHELLLVGGMALVVAIVRGLFKIIAIWGGRRFVEMPPKNAMACGMMLTPLGALAIGLVQTVQAFSPSVGGEVLPIVFAMVAILETLGPFAVSAAIRLSGESPLYNRPVPTSALPTGEDVFSTDQK